MADELLSAREATMRQDLCVLWPAALGLVLVSGACVMNKLDDAPTRVQLGGGAQGQAIELAVVKGAQWTHEVGAGPIRFNVLPQFAVWTQTVDGAFVDTLYVSGALYTSMTHAGKDREGAAFWKKCFPAWSRRVRDAGKALPCKEQPYPDGVSSATPQSSFTLRMRLPPVDAALDLLVEVNKSADPNAAFSEARTGWDGQPSIVYRARLPRGPGSPRSVVLVPVGWGDAAAVAQINPDLSGVDSALQIVQEIRVTLE